MLAPMRRSAFAGFAFSFAVVLALAVSLVARSAGASEREGDDEARAAFREGALFVEQTEWASAVGAFERSLALRPHALTIYNIGVCQRFLGRYTLARETLRTSLERAAETGELAELFVDSAKTYLAEMDEKLARVVVTVTPASTRVAVDGRPLAPSPGAPGVFVAGIAQAGQGRTVGASRFEVLVDPRSTVFTFAMDGYDTIEIRRDLKPGVREELPVSMALQPAQIRIAANVASSVVRVDGVDVGLSPVVVTRPPGVRVVSVRSEGYVPYESKVTLKPGQSVPLDARLELETPAITKKWWFWTAAAAVAAAVGVTTYMVAREPPARPGTDAGGLGWIAEVR